MRNASEHVWLSFLRHLRGRLTAGLLLLVPLLITYWVLNLAFHFLDGLFDPIVQRTLGISIPGLGIGLLLLLTYLAGLLATHWIGRGIIRAGQTAILQVPLVKIVYEASKQLIESFSGTGKSGFKRVVFIEHPRKEIWTLGFLTGTTTDENGKELGIVYVPTTPTPTSGSMVMLPMEDIRDTDMTVQAALRLVLSGGINSPAQIKKLAVS